MVPLRRRWAADCAAALPAADRQQVAATGAELIARWGEAHRHYHDATHLAEVLRAVTYLSGAEGLSARTRSAVVLAAWFHDAVYSVSDPAGNEDASAELAVRALQGLGAESRLVELVRMLVLDTATHDLGPTVRNPGRIILHDADLWILSAPVKRFDEYCEQVRREYGALPAGDYAIGRTAVLRPFLARPHVYRTRTAREQWEPAARENLAREISRLAG